MERVQQFLIAFVIVLALIAVFFWLWRWFTGTRLGSATTRGRQPRLAVIDAAVIDGRRRLVLIRRDNVEHLLMIGGPSDVVIEQNIVRAVPVAAAREAPAATRAVEPPRLPEIAPPPRVEAPSAWPLQPEPVPRPELEPALRQPRSPRIPESEGPPMSRPVRPVEPELRSTRLNEPEIPRQAEPMPRAVASGEAMAPRQGPPERPPFRASPAKAPAEPPRTAEPRPLSASAEDNLADMAQRLEAALRRPRPAGEERVEVRPDVAPPPLRDAPRMEPPREAPRIEPQRAPDLARAVPGEPKPDARPASPKSVLDSLEQEMASLLGRPAAKD
jgi:hypothetical protein